MKAVAVNDQVGKRPAHELAARTDFYAAWVTVESAGNYPAQTRARAFALWVGLFGCIDDDHVVTENTEGIAKRFEVSRASWLQYRRLLSDVGLIEQHRTREVDRRTVVQLHPPLC